METDKTTKRCPYCGEVIMASAKKCRHCKEWLVNETAPVRTKSKPVATENKDDDMSMTKTMAVMGGCGLIFWGAVALGIVLLLHFTVPSSSRMEKAIIEDVVDVSTSKVSDVTDMFDNDDLNLLAGILMNTDVATEEIINAFDKYNTIEIKESFCWSVGYIHNSRLPEEGVIGSFGFLGIVFPLVLWEDFQLMDTQSNEEIE